MVLTRHGNTCVSTHHIPPPHPSCVVIYTCSTIMQPHTISCPTHTHDANVPALSALRYVPALSALHARLDRMHNDVCMADVCTISINIECAAYVAHRKLKCSKMWNNNTGTTRRRPPQQQKIPGKNVDIAIHTQLTHCNNKLTH